MKKFTFLLLMACFVVLNANAQNAKLPKDYHYGNITMKDGSVLGGILHVLGGEEMPWFNQAMVEFITIEKFNNGNFKKKDVKAYKPKDIAGYDFDGRKFVSVKYANLSAVGPDMLARFYFLEPLTEGKITLYRFYQTAVTEGTDDVIIADMKRCLENPEVLVKKNEDKIKNVAAVEFADYISDNETVLEKYYAGSYGFKPAKSKDQKGVKGFLIQVMDGESINTYVLAIVQEYNQ